ncbi:MAG TPA: SDR family NAD(P)-dependent oxidoreductase [Moraxellaceae bacterium]|nr:SDR family NAD(P)-dependent oxidoreductase [Moraxellaceae bacterium]
MQKIVVITGGNSGIGLAMAQELAARGAHICMACRNMTKAVAARDLILARTPSAHVELYQLDLASFVSIRHFAAEIAERHPHIDVLINNAGAAPLTQQITADGFEMQFGANYLGHFLLTHLLLPSLSAALQMKGEARIVHVASIAHMIGRIRPDTFRGMARYRPGAAYAQSKLANLMFSNALARRLPTGITSQAFHPGGVDSEIWRELPRPVYYALKPFLISPERAGRLGADLALSAEHARENGGYYSAQWPRPVSRTARSASAQDQLYAQSCELTGVMALPVQR